MTLPLNTTADANDPVTLARYNMIEQQIRPWNVLDADVLDLLGTVRREDFVPPAYRGMAFMDMEIPLNPSAEEAQRLGQCMLAPRVEARLLQDLQVKPTDRVLEIGAGSGYMAALLAHRAEHVVTLEIVPDLVEFARENLLSAGIDNVAVRQGDGARDAIPDGPFDVIVLSGSVHEVPQHLLALLREGGRLAAITGDEPVMRATFVRRTGDRFATTHPWDTNAPRLQHFAERPRFTF
ncbi:protein-L-isoaspartate O-methyltransferase [Paracidovorax citrulli]|uniref:protein-L-isoaspartate O-methyltransferase family protein n=1 Tax=Paracidovorax citrulli TaxID=80869 RepID=UPI0005FC1516|nr:protein-L-isoaspartate O-methyltransferase [Paracidovorax citrulli]QCX12990.1 Protein-L-isoaspartate O-methyltransferase [Paracidovorax citrulli]UEG48040.1 protein-L-isoaspartate O-methyltransferase [Paracidovorax citrulli]UMT88719.1 protein-L-isoaspartate O-methyltransferase [Paracidovorax citrulli]UMT96692.1 protein-L-isoaspartate O-methyltransferase [Paracidovorax citrulli]WIY36554.1 protein-L-isoaspartate O-methyltransferase [Paracidovorax citrulli]